MPRVGSKHYPYTAKGQAAAKADAKRKGVKVSHGKGYNKGGSVSKSRVNLGAGAPKRKTRKKRAVKMQAGGPAGLSQAQQNLLRGAQEMAATSGQNPAALRKLTAQHGNLYNQRQQRRAQSQMAGNQPGRSAMRGIGPGMKKGGKVSNRSGFNLYGYRKGGSVKKK